MSAHDIPTQAAATIRAAVDNLPERDRHVFVTRLLVILDTVPTMQELADAWGVTRQRVEQLQRRVEDRMRRELDDDRSVRSLAADLREALGVAYPLAALKDVPLLAEMGEGEGSGATERNAIIWRTAVWFAGFHLQDGWALAHPGIKLVALRAGLPEEARERGLLSSAEAMSALAEKGLVPEAATALLTDHLPGFRRFGDALLPWAPSLTDKAEALLRWLGEPATPRQLLDLIGEDRSERGFRDRLRQDARFTRTTDGSAFALREWALDEYTTISDAIAGWIERAGGETPRREMVKGVASQGGWSERSVRSYARTPRFVTSAGLIRLRKDEPIPTEPADLAAVRGVELLERGRLRYTIEVTNEVLRGSGLHVPIPLAAALGVAPETERAFVTPQQEVVSVYWNQRSPQPRLRTIRELAEAMGCRLGDSVAFEFDPSQGSVAITRLAQAE